MKARCFPKNNYLSIYDKGKTFRFQIEDDLPITELEYPEFYDIKITNKCSGKCPWCYQDSTEEAEHFDDILKKTEAFFGIMDNNQKPFQVAIGGGNPNEHPDFVALVRYLHSIGVTPNYTTNGMGLDETVLAATAKYCGGVAVSAHPHLEEYWKPAIVELCRIPKLVVNVHVIISDYQSIDELHNIYMTYRDAVKYFVLLPYEAAGRAPEKDIDFTYLEEILNRLGPGELSQMAFGAGFYEWLLDKPYPMSLYEPELMSKYLDMSTMKLYKSSFDLTEVSLPGVLHEAALCS